MLRERGLALILLGVVVIGGSSTAQAVEYSIETPNGGDCAILGGFWVTGTSTCLLTSFNLNEDDTLHVVGVDVRFSGFTIINGTIDNLGHVIAIGGMWNNGTMRNRSIADSGIVSTLTIDGTLTNLEGRLLENQFDAMIHATPSGSLLNFGSLINSNIMTFDIDEPAESASVLLNAATVINRGELFGSATLTHPGALLDNRGVFDNHLGIIRNTHVDNQNLIEDGRIDDTGGAHADVINRVGATIDGAEITKVSLDNYGTLDNHIFGSGTIANHPGAMIRVFGGETYLVTNAGLIEFWSGFSMNNTFTNEATGTLINYGPMLNHSHLTNHGVLENRGPWTNSGDIAGQGVIDNHGTLLNLIYIDNCTQAPHTEQVNNFGTLSNSGSIPSCGSTNSGSWYECGIGGAPAGDPVIVGNDTDNDGICSGIDCADNDPGAWFAPSEVLEWSVTQDALTGLVEFSWSEPLYLGGTSVLYDVVSSPLPGEFEVSGSCLASGVPGDGHSDPAPVDPGAVSYFLVRASNCAPGSAGADSAGTPRNPPPCPD